MRKTKLVVIEGADSDSKDILLRMLAQRLENAGLRVKVLQPASQLKLPKREVTQLIRGTRYPMTSVAEVDLYQSALGRTNLKPKAGAGQVLLANQGYLSALIDHFYGNGSVSDYKRANEIINFATNGGRPDLTIVIDAPLPHSQQTASADSAFYERLRAGYLWEAKQRNLPLVFATEPVEAVSDTVWDIVSTALDLKSLVKKTPARTAKASPMAKKSSDKSSAKLEDLAAKKSPAYFIPENLSSDVLKAYQSLMDEILKYRDEIAEKTKDEPQNPSLLVTPFACYAREQGLVGEAVKIAGLAKDLEGNYSEAGPTTLVDYWPRNEFTGLASSIFSASTLDFSELTARIDAWSYDKKLAALKTIYKNATDKINNSYTFEFMASRRALIELEGSGLSVSSQLPTPRFGYDVPPAVENAGLADKFEACFDLSLKLYSLLQGSGASTETYYATLLGHKSRAKVSLAPSQLISLKKATKSQEISKLISEFVSSIESVHPVLAGQLVAVS